MELTSLHPLDLDAVQTFIAVANGDPAAAERLPVPASTSFADAIARATVQAAQGDETAANVLTHGLGQVLAGTQPSFFHQGLSLTAWEARIDRGLGMLMRPPARLFIDAGFDVTAARAMPTRLDLSRGMMGGSFIPARLIPELEELLEKRLERLTKRLIDAELDPLAVLGLMYEMTQYAKDNGLGLYEAIDVVTPDYPDALPPSAQIVVADRKRIDPALKKRIQIAAKPAKKPGIWAKMTGKAARSGNGLAHYPEGEQR